MISNQHNFIFVHFPRTGGSIFEQTYLQTYNQGTDPRVEVSGKNQKHFSALDYKENYPEKMNNFFTFGFIRNPYEVMVSIYFDNLDYKRISFEKFITSPSVKSVLEKYNNFFFANNKIAVEFLLKFEQYDQDMDHLCQTLGIDIPIKKISQNELKQRYNNLDQNKYKVISGCVDIAINQHNNVTGNALTAPIITNSDYTPYKAFIKENIEQLKDFFLNAYQLKITRTFVELAENNAPNNRDIDFYSYYRKLPNKKLITNLFKESCPRIFQLGDYSPDLP